MSAKYRITDFVRGGCDLHPGWDVGTASCFTCPFERCRYEGAGDAPIEESKRDRDNWIAALAREGWTTREIAELLGVTRRTVFRALKLQKEAS